MAFDINAFNNVSSGGANGAKLWSYKSAADNLATIAAADYFLPMRFAMGNEDIIFVVGSDGTQLRNVTSAQNASSVTTALFFGVGSIDTADLADGAVTAPKLATDAVTAIKIEADAVTTAKILDDAVTTVKIVDNAITTAKITDANVTTDKILNANVTSAKIASDAVDENKIVSTSFGSYIAGGSGTSIDVTTAVAKSVSVTLSAAQFLALYTTPIQIVAAGGANTLHVLQNVIYEINYGTVQYTGGGSVIIQYDSTANGAGVAASASASSIEFTGAAADKFIGGAFNLLTGASTAMVNKGLYIANDTFSFADGDSPVTAHVTYTTVTSAT